MKWNKLTTLAAATVLLLLTACNNDEGRLLTIINEDGTCIREISLHADPLALMTPPSEGIQTNCLHIGPDWERWWTVEGEDTVRHAAPMTDAQWDSLQAVFPKRNVSSAVTLHARREYNSAEEMSDSLAKVIQSPFHSTAHLERSFKWFYTDYTFQEAFGYRGKEPAFPIPLDRYVSPDTARFWFTGQPNLTEHLTGSEQKELLDNIEQLISQWMNANAFAYVCHAIASNYDDIKNPPVSKGTFLQKIDTLAALPAVKEMKVLQTVEQVADILRTYYHSEAYTPLLRDDNRMEHALARQYHQLQVLTLLRFSYDLVMPGKPLDAGMGELTEGGAIHYNFSGEKMLPGDYVFSATSRVTNVWAFVLTALIIVIAIGSLRYRKVHSA